ncbi:hypothetical protein PQI66_09975 [Corynebacterium sp. USCH3]|uniref:hypothetical protein n=1 Tax=Corynebacterium sp. USCH3 TaxID=3024840 RepID=UPI0030B6A640
MTILETILTLTLLVLVPWAVWSAIDLWRLRRGLNLIDAVHAEVAYVEVPDHERRLINHDTRLLTLEDSRSHTADLDVPTIHRPVPDDFWRNR